MSTPAVISNSDSEALSRGEEVTVSAIVLRARPYRDNDLMAQLLTPTLGKLSAIGRHARGSKKRFPSSLDLFDRGTARIGRERKGSLSIKEFTPARSLVKLRCDLDKLTLASLLCESFDGVIQENTGTSGQLFELLDLALNAIEEAEQLRPSLRATVVALHSLASLEGITDLSAHAPGSRMLHTLLDAIEHFTERRLITRPTVETLILKAAATPHSA